jgi:hypothetical protein
MTDEKQGPNGGAADPGGAAGAGAGAAAGAGRPVPEVMRRRRHSRGSPS